MPLSGIYQALTIKDFRLLLSSNSFYVVGEVATFVAQGWLVLSLTEDSALWVGVASGIRGVGHIGFALIGGVMADRIRRRTALAIVALFRAGIFAVLGLLIITGEIQLWHVMIIVFIQGSGDGLMAPFFNGLIYDTVGPNRLMNALAYILAVFHISWATGSIAAGHLMNTMGIGFAYSLASIFCLLSIIPLMLMRVSNVTQADREPIASNIVQGIHYVFQNKPLRVLLILSMLTEAFGFSYLIMLPVIAKTVLAVGPTGLGYLAAAGGIGSLIGTAVIAVLSEFGDKWKLLAIATMGAGVSILLFASSPWYGLSLILVGFIGLSLVTYDAAINTLIQTLSADNMRGRVLGLYGMTWGFTPAGGFVAGSVASVIGAPIAVGLGGIIILAYTIVVIARVDKSNP